MNDPNKPIQIGPQLVLHVGQTSTPLHIEGNGICEIHARDGCITVILQDNEAFVNVSDASDEHGVSLAWEVPRNPS